jgi:hypothetical protein
MVYLGITYTSTEEEILLSPLTSSDQGHHRGNCQKGLGKGGLAGFSINR